MPFEIPQKTAEPDTKVRRFQKYADAILIGCQKSPTQCKGHFFYAGATCALGAMALGLGFNPEEIQDPENEVESFLPNDVCIAYDHKYHRTIPEDNDEHGYTREQIAARIAAL